MAQRHRSISVTEARNELSDIFGEVNYKKERIILSNHKKCVAIVPIEDLQRLEALEDAEDVRAAELALKEIKKKGSVSFEAMKKRLS